jgi:hypothetical protein
LVLALSLDALPRHREAHDGVVTLRIAAHPLSPSRLRFLPSHTRSKRTATDLFTGASTRAGPRALFQYVGAPLSRRMRSGSCSCTGRDGGLLPVANRGSQRRCMRVTYSIRLRRATAPVCAARLGRLRQPRGNNAAAVRPGTADSERGRVAVRGQWLIPRAVPLPRPAVFDCRGLDEGDVR